MLKQIRSIGLVMCMVAASFASDRTTPMIVAHRGASHDAPENTLASMKLAIEQDADALESDFHLTADGKIIANHDKDTKRTSGGASEKLISETTFEELRRIDVGAWKGPHYAGQIMPTLTEMLHLLPPGKVFLIELKTGPEIVPELQRELAAVGTSHEQLRIISFNADTIAAAKKALPTIKAYWLTSYKKDDSGVMQPTLEKVLATLKRCNADGLDTKADRDVVTPEFVKAVRAGGYELHVWTVDDPAVAKHFVGLGVDSVTTNRPAFMREQLAR